MCEMIQAVMSLRWTFLPNFVVFHCEHWVALWISLKISSLCQDWFVMAIVRPSEFLVRRNVDLSLSIQRFRFLWVWKRWPAILRSKWLIYQVRDGVGFHCIPLTFALMTLTLTLPTKQTTFIELPVHLLIYALNQSFNCIAVAQSIKLCRCRSRASVNGSLWF